MTEKNHCGVQTEQLEDNSWRKHVELSTGESELTSETRCERRSVRRNSQSQNKSLCRKTTAMITQKQRLNDSRLMRTNGKERAPLTKKYKFIPTLSFKHI